MRGLRNGPLGLSQERLGLGAIYAEALRAMIRRFRDAALLTFAACQGYHLLTCAARLIGVHAVRDATRFDPEALHRIIAEYDTAS